MNHRWANPPGTHKPPDWMVEVYMEGRTDRVQKVVAVPARDLKQYATKVCSMMCSEEDAKCEI
jgi:hypothetical protein